jgi:hypothetical protein
MRQAALLVADEVTFSLNGKLNIFGTYTADIGIQTNPTPLTQLIFLFVIETDPGDPYVRLEVNVTLPGGDQRHQSIITSRLIATPSDQRRWILRYPFLFTNPILRPGPIEAKVIHDQGEIIAAAPSIVMIPPLSPSTQH